MPFHVSSTVRAAVLRSSVLSLANTCSMGFRSGLYGGRKINLAPALRIAWRTAWLLWLPRLSSTTMSPWRNVGTRHCSTHAKKLRPLMGPSRTHGAQMPSARKPAMKVSVFQWPCGTLAIKRSPRGHHPRIGVMFVLAQVSSTKIKREASILP